MKDKLTKKEKELLKQIQPNIIRCKYCKKLFPQNMNYKTIFCSAKCKWRSWYHKNRKKCIKWQVEYRNSPRGKALKKIYDKNYSQAHPDKAMKHYWKHREECLARNKAWRENKKLRKWKTG